MSLRFNLVKDTPELIFLKEFFLKEFKYREYQLIEEYPLVLIKLGEEGRHLL
jgi:hypothetical protein